MGLEANEKKDDVYVKSYIRKLNLKKFSKSSIFKHIDGKEDNIEVWKKSKMPKGLY